ncbi:hypothetical protein F5X98DRAFT_357426 [Xylaria grammica]|nr:hypothetical protein F5X98DRAFT_357426 [Xylaria grammica]
MSPYLEIFSSLSPSSIPSFTLFPALPPELRDEVWRLALEQYQQVIKIRLRDRYLMDALLARRGDARPESRQDESYGAVVEGHQTLSKVFHVCRRSRDVAMAFYRVRLPCWFVTGLIADEAMKPGILYVNPEVDFLYIVRNEYTNGGNANQAIHFLNDFKTVHDPHHTGLLNLAVDFNGLSSTGGGPWGVDLASLDRSLNSSLTETLKQLRQVFFVQLQVSGRYVLGYATDQPSSHNHVNRAVPTMPIALSFCRLHPDPRPIMASLSKVYLESNPGQMAHRWRRLLANYLGDGVQSETEYRVLLACTSMYEEIFNYKDAQQWLEKENSAWSAVMGNDERSMRLLEADTTQTAFGFWLFPLDAFGPLPRSPHDVFANTPPTFMDLTLARPDLAVVELPNY